MPSIVLCLLCAWRVSPASGCVCVSCFCLGHFLVCRLLHRPCLPIILGFFRSRGWIVACFRTAYSGRHIAAPFVGGVASISHLCVIFFTAPPSGGRPPCRRLDAFSSFLLLFGHLWDLPAFSQLLAWHFRYTAPPDRPHGFGRRLGIPAPFPLRKFLFLFSSIYLCWALKFPSHFLPARLAFFLHLFYCCLL